MKLYAHATGRWAKKIRGKVHYFGEWDDPDGALDLYQRVGPQLHAGRAASIVATPDAIDVRALLNRFLTTKAAKVEAGELTPQTWRTYKKIAEEIRDVLGARTPAGDVRPADFARLRERFAVRWSIHTVAQAVVVTRMVFRWAYDTELIERPVRFGESFKKPPAKLFRKARNTRRILTDAEVRAVLGEASVPMRAMILLGINCGFGNNDCATLTLPMIQWESRLVIHPRPKTGVQRAAVLWPETVAALQQAIAVRPEPRQSVDAGTVFVTNAGRQWVRTRASRDKAGKMNGVCSCDAIAQEWGKIATKLKLKKPRERFGFYTLRHTFRTVADAAGDQHAVHRIMGHSLPGMSDVYVHGVESDRLAAVAAHVLDWLGLGD